MSIIGSQFSTNCTSHAPHMDNTIQPDNAPAPAQPFHNQRGPIKPEEILAGLQSLHPEMMAPFPNEKGVLSIKLNDLYMAACGVKDTTARGKRQDLLANHGDFCNQYVSEMRVHKSKCLPECQIFKAHEVFGFPTVPTSSVLHPSKPAWFPNSSN